MSQSSTSSPSPRKRRMTSCSSSPSSVWSSQRKKENKLTLKKEVLQNWVPELEKQNSKKSMTDDFKSIDSSLSIGTSSTKNENIVPNYLAIASKYGIKPGTAKKHISVLATDPKVHLVLIDPNRLIFEEPFDISQLMESAKNLERPPSPVLNKKARKRGKPRIKKEPIDFSASENLETQFNTVEQSKDSLRTSQNIEKYFESMVKQEVQDVNDIPFSQEMTQLTGEIDSAYTFNSFSDKEKTFNSSCNYIKSTLENSKIVTNPFSKKKMNKIKCKNKKSYLEKKYGESNSEERKKKFYSTFAKISNNEVQLSESSDEEISPKTPAQLTVSSNGIKHKNSKNRSMMQEHKIKSLNSICANSDDTNVESGIDSMSVNCNPRFRFQGVEIKNNGSEQQNSPLPFGSVSDTRRKLDTVSSNNKLKNHVSEMDCDSALENYDYTKLTNDDPSNKSFSILDLFDSPPNFDFSSPEKASMRNSISSEESLNSKAVPYKSKSSEQKNSIFTPAPKEINQLTLGSKSDKIQLASMSNGSLSPRSSAMQIDNHEMNDNFDLMSSWNPNEILDTLNLNTNKEVKENDGLTSLDSSLQAEKNSNCNNNTEIMESTLVPEERINKDKIQNTESPIDITLNTTMSNNVVDESFDNLCNTLVQMTDNEKDLANQKEMNDTRKKIIESNIGVPPSVSKIETVSLFNETPPNVRPKSPVLSRISRSNRHSVSLKSRLTKRTSMSSSQPPSLPARNLDPRLNKTLSPNKSKKLESKPRSTSPAKSVKKNEEPWDSFVTPDSISLMEDKDDIPMEKIVDPRLRKRKEREDAEKALKLVDKLSSSDYVDTSPIGNPPKKIKLSAFDRLGAKTKSRSPSPVKKSDFLSNELKNIFKEAKKFSGSDDEEVLDIYSSELFSDEDSDTEGPKRRHSKFTSERLNGEKNTSKLNQRQGVVEKLPQLSRMNVPVAMKNQTLATSNVSVNNNYSKSNVYPANNISKPNSSTVSSLKQNITKIPKVNKLGVNSTPLFSNNKENNSMRPESHNSVPIANRLGRLTNNDFTNKLGSGIKSRITPRVTNNFQIPTKPRTPDNQLEDQNSNSKEREPYATHNENTPLNQNTTYDHSSILEGRTEVAKIGMSNSTTTFFRNYCYRTLSKGYCSNESKGCSFSHQATFLQRLVKQKKGELLTKILDFAIEHDFGFFLLKVWSSILPNLKDNCLDYFEKLYRANFYSKNVIHELIEYCLQSKLYSIESFAKKIALIIKTDDKQLVKDICHEIKPKIRDGFCWETIKCLCQKAPPSSDMVELSILQCINRKKSTTHIKEIYELVRSRMSQNERNLIDQDLLKKFFNHVQQNDVTPLDREVLATIPLKNGNRLETDRTLFTNNTNFGENNRPVTKPNNHSLSKSNNLRVPNNQQLAKPNDQPISFKKKKMNPIAAYASQPVQPSTSYESDLALESVAPKQGENVNFDAFVPKILETSEVRSCANPLYKKHFWKLSIAVEGINQGLEHGDYAYAWRIMDEFSKENVEDDLVLRAYYHILCKNIKSSQHHISEIIRTAVLNRWSTLRKSIEILFNIGVSALIELANHRLWVMALKLLESVKIIKPDENKTAFILISAEIYLANYDPLEALYLLQKTRIIRTNRDEWLVKDSTQEDEIQRNRIVFILLVALSYHDPEKAVYLFKSLMEDQYISYYPIDLPSYADKMILLLLLQDKYKSVVEVCRTVMDNDLTFKKSTYQEIICKTLSFDELFANQVMEYAVHLGYYTDIQIRQGFTTLIIDSNSTEEELYMILKRLIKKLQCNVGVAIDHLKPNQLKVILIFEDIPVDRRLYKDEIAEFPTKDKYKNIRNLVHTVLATRFNPPIKINRTLKTKDKFCKIISRSLIEHLKYWT